MNCDFISENALKKGGRGFGQELCASSGISITPGGGNAQWGCIGADSEGKNLLWCQKKEPPL